MKDQQKKLFQYTSMAGAVLGSAAAEGQISYTNIPDTTVDTHKGVYNLDLDQDGNMDFRITQYLDTGTTGLVDAIFIAPYDSINGRAMGELQNGFSYPFNLIPGDSIGIDELWNGNTDVRVGYLVYQYDGTPYPNSNWKGPVTDGFMGLQIRKSDGFHFGWVRLNIAADNRSFTVKDFAYNSSANEGMLAAEPTLSAAEFMLENFMIGQEGMSLFLEKPATTGEVNVRVMNLEGKVLVESPWSDSRMQLDVPAEQTGVILVEFEYRGLRLTKKVLLIES